MIDLITVYCKQRTNSHRCIQFHIEWTTHERCVLSMMSEGKNNQKQYENIHKESEQLIDWGIQKSYLLSIK